MDCTTKSTARFTGRSKQYVKFRPSYPLQVFQHLRETIGWKQEKRIADIGAGTGIFTKLMLEQGNEVIAIEPNDDMRNELIEQLKTYLAEQEGQHASKLSVIDGSAEMTGLPDESVDGIVCAQSFHWFDQKLARAEFSRILKPQADVVLLWNQRDVQASPFVRDYEALFSQYGDQYDQVKHKQMSVEALSSFYGSKPQLVSYYYEQPLQYEQLIGRIQSSSFSITEQDERYEAYMNDIKAIFARHEQAGIVNMIYRTDVYWGKLD